MCVLSATSQSFTIRQQEFSPRLAVIVLENVLAFGTIGNDCDRAIDGVVDGIESERREGCACFFFSITLCIGIRYNVFLLAW